MFVFQGSREESRSSSTSSAASSNVSQKHLEEVLQKPGPYPMIVLPPSGGYWVDGQDHECPFDSRGNPILPQNNWRAKFETDDTAKCYRRFFVGRVSTILSNVFLTWVQTVLESYGNENLLLK